MLDEPQIGASNDEHAEAHRSEFEATAAHLERKGHDIEALLDRLSSFEVAVPSWALGTGGTRFGRFPGPGEPRNVYEKMEDVAVIQQLTRATPRVSLHIPWDEPDDVGALKEHADELQLGFDAVNSNTFQDQPGQEYSYKFGSFSHTDQAVRQQAVEHNLHVLNLGEELGSEAITIWLADGSNYPGQMHLRKSFDRVLECLQQVYDALPSGWRLYTEHKPYEPAFYATVVQDWGSSLMFANRLGEQAQCLVDLGHHLPNTNIELVVARLLTAGKLGGFHFNDSKYGDDDLTTASISPYQLFLVFNELVDAEENDLEDFDPDYMIDQSHNLKDPIEAFLQTVDQLQQAYAKAILVDRDRLATHRQKNDVLKAEDTLKEAYETDVGSLVAEARRQQNGALAPISAFRASGYRKAKHEERSEGAYNPPQSL